MKNEIENTIRNSGKLTPEQIKQKMESESRSNNERLETSNEINVTRGKNFRSNRPEQFLQEHEKSTNININIDNDNSSKPTETDQVKDEEKPKGATDSDMEIEDTGEEKKKKKIFKKGEEQQEKKGGPITFVQSIIAILLSGAILVSFGVLAWKALDDVFVVDVYNYTSDNIGILNNEVDIADTNNVVYDVLTKEESTVHVVELPYTYDKRNKTVIFEYDGITYNYPKERSNLKFKKQGTLLANIYFDNYGEVENYEVVEIIE